MICFAANPLPANSNRVCAPCPGGRRERERERETERDRETEREISYD